MYQEFYSHSTLLHLPLLAMALFMGSFTAVLWHVLRRKSDHAARDEQLSQLPLNDDDETVSALHGGRHG